MRRVASTAAVVVLIAAACAALEIPPLERRVTDLAGMLSSSSVVELEAELDALERDTGAQLAVLTIPSLEGLPLEDVSIRVVDAWRLGQVEDDNGVLILIARDDREIRIEVGYGLEGVLPDALCGRIIDNAMKPAFRQGDFSGGTLRAVEIIAGIVRGEPEVRTAVSPPSRELPEFAATAVMALFFAIFVGAFAMSALFAPGCVGWFLYLFLTPFFAAFPDMLFGPGWGSTAAAIWFFGFPILRLLLHHTDVGKRVQSSPPVWTSWGSSGGSWGGSSFSGGSSFGGFSGGGGSFGGGGASGGW